MSCGDGLWGWAVGSGGGSCHSGGFLLRIMPPSWQLSPARSRKDHSLQSQRWCCRRAFLYRHDEGAAAVLKSSPEIKNRGSPEAILEFFLASIPKSGLEIKNRCTKDGIFRQNHASIPKSGPEIKNQCTKDGISRQNPTSIPKSGPEIKNHCSIWADSEENLVVILKSEPEIKNHCTLEGVFRQIHAVIPKFTP